MAQVKSSADSDFTYFCDTKALPAPLPTLDEIEAAETTLPCLWPPAQKRIAVVRRVFVVKYGIPRLVDGNEGHALRALQGIPTIPKLYAMYRDQNKHFLVMEYLPGKPLDHIWDSLSEHDKDAVTQQLRGTFARVRNLSCPSPPVFGSVARGPVPHRFFMTLTGDPNKTGPFATEAGFHNAIALRLRQDLAEGNRPNWTADFLESHLASAMGGHACVLTHGDLQLKNILVHQPLSRQADSAKESARCSELRVSGIVDWENAGWMPSYWEYASMFINADWGSDWAIKFEQIVDAWPAEAAMLMFVCRSFDGF